MAPNCDLCGGTSWKPVAGGRVERCECWIAQQKTFAENVPLEFRLAALANYREIEGNLTGLKAAKAFVDDTRDLYLAGGVGAGKTRLACSILNDMHRNGTRGVFVRVPMLLWKLQPSQKPEITAEANRLTEALATAPVAVLDDVGAERDSATDFTRRTLLTLYEERGDKGLRTIWTSNLRLDVDPRQAQNPHRQPTLGEFMGDDRLASRIAGRAALVLLTTRDQRLQKTRAVAS